MGTLKDYFESDSKEPNIRHSLSIFSPQGLELGYTITFKIHLLIEAHSKYLSIYSGKNVGLDALFVHLKNKNLRTCDIAKLMGQDDRMHIEMGGVSLKDLVFTNKLIVYVEEKLTDEQVKLLMSHGKSQGFKVEVRDINYAEERSRTERPLAFISHAKSDSREFAIKLANALTRLGCPVWFDEYSMKVGDSLVESIESGLKETDKCIFILSPGFLKNEGWCKHEFKTASMKQIFEKRKVMLPIWHGVNADDVYQYSAILADKVGVQSSLGEDQVAKKISDILLAK